MNNWADMPTRDDATSTGHGVGNDGQALHYYLNYSSQPVSVTYNYGNGQDLLSGRSLKHGQNADIAAWDLLIIREGKATR